MFNKADGTGMDNKKWTIKFMVKNADKFLESVNYRRKSGTKKTSALRRDIEKLLAVIKWKDAIITELDETVEYYQDGPTDACAEPWYADCDGR